MSTNTMKTPRNRPIQLSLALSEARPLVDVNRLPPQLRVSDRTRQVGRVGIAEARAILAARQASRAA